MNYFSTGIETVDKMGKLNYTGNVKPLSWHKTIVNEKGKPQRLAMDILADICYWYRPTEVRDETSGQVIGWKKKFAADMLQRSYSDLMEFYCEEKKTIVRAIVFLEELGVIKRVFRKLKYQNGMTANNVMFIDLNYEKLYELTYPEELVVDRKTNSNATEEFEVLEEHSSTENQVKKDEKEVQTELSIGVDKFVDTSLQICPEGTTKMSIPHDKIGESLSTVLSIGCDKFVETNTYNTTEITTENTSVSYLFKNIDEKASTDVDMDAITFYVEQLLGYEHIIRDEDEDHTEDFLVNTEFNGILAEIRNILVYEVFAAPDEKMFNFGTKDYPDYKSNMMLKKIFEQHLNFGHVKSYIEQYLMNSTSVKNVTMYHIKSLYRQCLTGRSQYLSGGNSFFVRK